MHKHDAATSSWIKKGMLYIVCGFSHHTDRPGTMFLRSVAVVFYVFFLAISLPIYSYWCKKNRHIRNFKCLVGILKRDSAWFASVNSSWLSLPCFCWTTQISQNLNNIHFPGKKNQISWEEKRKEKRAERRRRWKGRSRKQGQGRIWRLLPHWALPHVK